MDNKIKNWITPNPAVVDVEDLLVNAIHTMAEKQIGAILVTQNDELSGIFTERDLLRLFSDNTEKAFKEYLMRPIKTIMTASPSLSVVSDIFLTVVGPNYQEDYRRG